jgi:hypothetical protein
LNGQLRGQRLCALQKLVSQGLGSELLEPRLPNIKWDSPEMMGMGLQQAFPAFANPCALVELASVFNFARAFRPHCTPGQLDAALREVWVWLALDAFALSTAAPGPPESLEALVEKTAKFVYGHSGLLASAEWGQYLKHVLTQQEGQMMLRRFPRGNVTDDACARLFLERLGQGTWLELRDLASACGTLPWASCVEARRNVCDVDDNLRKQDRVTLFQRMQNLRAEETRQSVSAEPISIQDFTRFVQKDFELEAHELAPIPLYLDPLRRGVVSDVDLVGVTQAQIPLPATATQPATQSVPAATVQGALQPQQQTPAPAGDAATSTVLERLEDLFCLRALVVAYAQRFGGSVEPVQALGQQSGNQVYSVHFRELMATSGVLRIASIGPAGEERAFRSLENDAASATLAMHRTVKVDLLARVLPFAVSPAEASRRKLAGKVRCAWGMVEEWFAAVAADGRIAAQQLVQFAAELDRDRVASAAEQFTEREASEIVAQEAKWSDTFGVPAEYAPRDRINAQDFLRALKPLVLLRPLEIGWAESLREIFGIFAKNAYVEELDLKQAMAAIGHDYQPTDLKAVGTSQAAAGLGEVDFVERMVPVMRQCLDWGEQPLVLARELEDAFRRFDYDASGALDRKEFLQAMASFGLTAEPSGASEADRLFDALDTDGSGEVDLEELLAAATRSLKEGSTIRELLKLRYSRTRGIVSWAKLFRSLPRTCRRVRDLPAACLPSRILKNDTGNTGLVSTDPLRTCAQTGYNNFVAGNAQPAVVAVDVHAAPPTTTAKPKSGGCLCFGKAEVTKPQEVQAPAKALGKDLKKVAEVKKQLAVGVHVLDLPEVFPEPAPALGLEPKTIVARKVRVSWWEKGRGVKPGKHVGVAAIVPAEFDTKKVPAKWIFPLSRILIREPAERNRRAPDDQAVLTILIEYIVTIEHLAAVPQDVLCAWTMLRSEAGTANRVTQNVTLKGGSPTTPSLEEPFNAKKPVTVKVPITPFDKLGATQDEVAILPDGLYCLPLGLKGSTEILELVNLYRLQVAVPRGEASISKETFEATPRFDVALATLGPLLDNPRHLQNLAQLWCDYLKIMPKEQKKVEREKAKLLDVLLTSLSAAPDRGGFQPLQRSLTSDKWYEDIENYERQVASNQLSFNPFHSSQLAVELEDVALG